jgi:hypothetical protein
MRRNRAVWYRAATLPWPVRHGDPAGAAQDDIGQSLASTRRKSSSFTRRSVPEPWQSIGGGRDLRVARVRFELFDGAHGGIEHRYPLSIGWPSRMLTD